MKLLGDVGEACARDRHENVRALTSERIQCDEIWAFVGCKAKNVSRFSS